MVAALEEMQDASEFSESYCASLADSSAPGCQLVEVFNSHGVFLPQLAGEQGLSSESPLQPHSHTASQGSSRQLHASGHTVFRAALAAGSFGEVVLRCP